MLRGNPVPQGGHSHGEMGVEKRMSVFRDSHGLHIDFEVFLPGVALKTYAY